MKKNKLENIIRFLFSYIIIAASYLFIYFFSIAHFLVPTKMTLCLLAFSVVINILFVGAFYVKDEQTNRKSRS